MEWNGLYKSDDKISCLYPTTLLALPNHFLYWSFLVPIAFPWNIRESMKSLSLVLATLFFKNLWENYLRMSHMTHSKCAQSKEPVSNCSCVESEEWNKNQCTDVPVHCNNYNKVHLTFPVWYLGFFTSVVPLQWFHSLSCQSHWAVNCHWRSA